MYCSSIEQYGILCCVSLLKSFLEARSFWERKRQQNSATAKHAAFSIRKKHQILKSYHTKPKMSNTLSKNQQIWIFKCCSPQHWYISNNINNLKYLRHYVWEQFTMQLRLLGRRHLRAMFRLLCPCKRHMQCEEQQPNS